MKLALVLLAACGGHIASSVPVAPEPPHPFATEQRAAAAGEDGLANVTLDPALDCIARKLGHEPKASRYRGELAIACGTPLLPIDARFVPARELVAAVADMRKALAADVPAAIGIAHDGDHVMVVLAARLVELEPFAPGARTIRGRVTMPFTKIGALVASARGVERAAVTYADGAFSLPAPAGDADVELVIIDGREEGPLARVRVGEGSPLFSREGSLLARTNAARGKLGLPPLRASSPLGECKDVPARVGDVDVTDRAHCHWAPHITIDELASEALYSPLIQLQLVGTRAALLEFGERDGGAGLRVLEQFETLSPEIGRARVLASLRARWPELAEHPAAAGLLDEPVQAWIDNGDYTVAPPAASARLEDIAAHWTPGGHYYSLVVTSRDLDTALARLAPDARPFAVDFAFRQVRDRDGAMRHVLAIVLALP